MAVNDSLKLRDIMLFSRIRELNQAEIKDFYKNKIAMDDAKLKALSKAYDRCLGFLFRHDTLIAALFFEEKMIDEEHVWTISGFRTTTPETKKFIMATMVADLLADKNIPVVATLTGEEAVLSKNYKAGKLKEISHLDGVILMRREALTEEEQDRAKKLALKTAKGIGRAGLSAASAVGRAGASLRDRLLR